MTGIIWYYTTRRIGTERFQRLIEDYKKIHIYPVQLTTNYVVFDNKDYWKLCPANDRSKGQTCNVGLIEQSTPPELINTVIMPCIKSYPYRAYNYY